MYSDDKRKNSLTEEDINNIVAAFIATSDKQCSCPVDAEDLKEAVKFFKNVNDWFDGSKRTIWNTFLVAAVMGILSMISLGIWMKQD